MISFFRTVASVPPSSSKALLFVPTNSTLPSSTSTSTQKSLEHQLGEELCETIIKLEDFYQILGVERKVSTEDIRRGFLSRSRIIHPELVSFSPPFFRFVVIDWTQKERTDECE